MATLRLNVEAVVLAIFLDNATCQCPKDMTPLLCWALPSTREAVSVGNLDKNQAGTSPHTLLHSKGMIGHKMAFTRSHSHICHVHQVYGDRQKSNLLGCVPQQHIVHARDNASQCVQHAGEHIHHFTRQSMPM